MIIKKSSGSGFRGTLNYVLHDKPENGFKDRSEIIGGNMSGLSVDELSREFSLLRKIKPDIEKPVRHFSIRNHDSDRELSKEEWLKLGNDFLRARGYDSLALMVLHRDCGKPHMHIITSQVKFDGTTTNEFKDFSQLKTFCREKEAELGLYRVSSKPTGNSKLYFPRQKNNCRIDQQNQAKAQASQERTQKLEAYSVSKEYLQTNKQEISANSSLCNQVIENPQFKSVSNLILQTQSSLCASRQSLIAKLGSGRLDKYQEAEILRQLADVEKSLSQAIRDLIRAYQDEAQQKENLIQQQKQQRRMRI